MISRPHRTVHFDESYSEFHDDNQCSAENWSESWCTPEEYAQFKSDTRHLANKVLLGIDDEKKSFCATVQQTYKTSCEVDCDSKCSADMLSGKEMERLASVYMSNIALIGLEYFAVHSITKDARGRREFLPVIVFNIKKECNISGDNVAEELRESCRSITRTSSLFAQYMAQGQLIRIAYDNITLASVGRGSIAHAT